MPMFFGGLLREAKLARKQVSDTDERARLFVDRSDKSPDTNLFYSCCQAMSASPVEEALFFAVLAYGAQGGDWQSGTALTDLLRIMRNRLLASERERKLEKRLPDLLAEVSEFVRLTVQHGDAYAALEAWPMLPKDFEPEYRKAAWLRPGSSWRARLLAVEDAAYFRGALHLLNSPEWPDNATLNHVLQALEALWLDPVATADPEFSSLVVRALAATPGAVFYEVSSDYRYWSDWSNLLTRQNNPARTSAFQCFACLYAEAPGDWKTRLAHVRDKQVPDRRQEALASNGFHTTSEEKQWPYYMARYSGMTFRKNWPNSSCSYKWWNWQWASKAYQSCARLQSSTLGGNNFHPFAWAAVQEWNDSIAPDLITGNAVTLNSPEENGAEEKPLQVIRKTTSDEKPETIKLFYGHINPCGWRLELPKHLELAPSLQDRFEWRTHEFYLDARHVQQTWLVGVKCQELDHIETVLKFAKALAAPNSLQPRQPDSEVQPPIPAAAG